MDSNPTQNCFLILIFGMLIQREDIPLKGSRKNFQSIARRKIIFFYRRNEKEDNVFNNQIDRK